MSICALPAVGFAGSKLTCAVNLLNLPSTGTFICFEVAVTELFATSTCASAAPAALSDAAANAASM
ncbi:hypothetical protein HDG41_002078 [Paraburkholderia sp. JPY162]|uniref:Uncharacterized protein n=1 Tax=Paraburkholderia youngii TaxID=2782701 RepID=A0A7W8L6P1_9BURK|nr:hypothetical protein [Paraburkholderia youngii]